MDQKFCENCGSIIDSKMKFCPNCGAKNNFFVDKTMNSGENSATDTNSFAQNSNDQYGNGQYGNGQYGNGQYSNGQYGNDQYNNNQYNNNQYNNGQYAWNGNNSNGDAPIWKNPNEENNSSVNIGLLVFSILNIVLGCCCLYGSIVGIAALVFTLLAPRMETAKQAKVFNTIALVLNIVAVIVTVVIIISSMQTVMVEVEKALAEMEITQNGGAQLQIPNNAQ